MAGGHVVGKIAIRVVPNTKGFRQTAEKAINGQMSGVRIKARVVPDTRGFARDVNKAATSAAKAASGKAVTFDAQLEALGLGAKAKAAAIAASGNKINFGVDIDRRGLRGLARSLATGFRSVSVVQSKGLFASIQRQLEHVRRGLEKVSQAGKGLDPVINRFKLFGRSIDKATRPVVSFGKRIRSIAQISRREMGRLADFGYGEWRAGLYRVVEGFADLRQAGKRFDREVIVPLQAGFQNIGEKGLNQLRKAGFGDQIEHSLLRARAEMDRLKAGTKDFVREWSQHHSIGDRLAMGLKGAREEMGHLGRQMRDTPAGFQIEQALRRAQGEAVALRNRMREIGESDRWNRFAKGAEKAARRVRALDFTFGKKGRATVTLPSMDRQVRSMKRFTAEANKANGAVSKLAGKIPVLGRLLGQADKKAGGFFKNFRQKYFQPDSTIGFIVAAVAALIAPVMGLVGSLMAGLPTLLGSIGAAAGVVALGFQGIKDAVQPLTAALDPLKTSLSGVFREAMTPQFEKLAGLIPQITPGLEKIATGMTKVTGAFVDAVMMPQNIEKLNGFLDKTAGLFSQLAPGVESFTEGFLTMFDGAAQGFPAMARVFNDFASTFSQDMARLVDTGAMKAAMESLADVTGSLMTNIHKLLVAGVEVMPQVAEGLIALFDGVAEGLIDALPLLADFSNFAGKALGGLIRGLGAVFQEIQPGMSRIFDTLTQTFGTLINEVGPELASFAGKVTTSFAGILEKLGPAIERLSPRIADLVSQLGDGLVTVLDTLAQGDTLDKLADSMVKFGEAAINAATTGLSAIIPLLPQLIDSFAQLATTLANGLLEDMTQFAVDALPLATSALESLIEALQLVLDISNKLSSDSGFFGFINKLGGLTELIIPGIGPVKDLAGAFGALKGETDSATESAATYGPTVATASEQAKAAAEAVPDLGSAWQGAVEGIRPPLLDMQTSVTESTQTAVDTANTNLSQLPVIAGTQAAAATAAAQAGMGSLGVLVSSVAGEATSGAASALAPLPGIVSSNTAGLAGTVQSNLAPLPGYVATAGAEMTTAANTAMTTVNTEIQTGVATAGATAATLVPTVQAGIGPTAGVLVGSGQALVDGFIQGIRSRIGAVSAAAAEVAAAAKANFPNSPAKEGPLSGRGYTTYSGHALVEDFAKGMQGRRNYVQDAAADVAADIQKGIEQYQKAIDGYHESNLVDPIMEANAKKIHDFRKREREALEKGNADLGKIAEDRKKMLESLEVPDFREIDRSIQSYYIDGTKGLFQAGLLKQAKDQKFAAQLRGVALQAVKDARETFDNHPMLDQIEANVNAKHFERSIEEAIEASEIGYVPIELAITNLDQLKSDLGFGDGALSRAMSAVLEFNPNDTDAYRYEKEAKEEVHYHVADMHEAMRLEDERRRRGALRYI